MADHRARTPFTITSVVVAALAMSGLGCTPLRTGPTAPPQPPAARHESCLNTNGQCQAGLTCVSYTDSLGSHADCEIPCGAGCPDGTSCGTRHSPLYGDGAANVCI